MPTASRYAALSTVTGVGISAARFAPLAGHSIRASDRSLSVHLPKLGSATLVPSPTSRGHARFRSGRRRCRLVDPAMPAYTVISPRSRQQVPARRNCYPSASGAPFTGCETARHVSSTARNLRTARRDDDSSVATYSLATRESRLPGAPPPLSPRPRSPSLARSSIMRYAFARGACSRGLHACLTNSFINGGWTRTVSWSGWGPRSIWISDAPGKTGPGFRVELFVGLAQALPLPLLHHGNASVDPYCVGMRHHP